MALGIGGAGALSFLLLLYFLRNKQCSRCHTKAPISQLGWKRRPGDGDKPARLYCPRCWYDQTEESEMRVRDWLPKRNDARLIASVRESFARFKQGECYTVGLERMVEWNGVYLSVDLLEEMANCADIEGVSPPARGAGEATAMSRRYPCEHLRTAARWAIRQQQKYGDLAKKLGLLE